MVKIYISTAMFLILGIQSCEKNNVLHPNMVVLGYPEIGSFEPE